MTQNWSKGIWARDNIVVAVLPQDQVQSVREMHFLETVSGPTRLQAMERAP